MLYKTFSIKLEIFKIPRAIFLDGLDIFIHWGLIIVQ